MAVKDDYVPTPLRKRREREEAKRKKQEAKEERKRRLAQKPKRKLKEVPGRNGKPRKSYVELLRPIERSDFATLEKACLDAYLLKSSSVIVAFSYLATFPDDFPYRTIVRKLGANNYYKINAKSLLKWLREKGYTELTGSTIGLAIQKFQNYMKQLDGLF